MAEIESKKSKSGEVVAEDEPNKRKSNKKAFIYGNYKIYYGYRVDRNQEEDPRLEVFKKEWFEGKECLDIGCNQGLITISIAQKFFCRTILGIDIDAGLIDSANLNLRKLARQGKMSNPQVPGSSADCLKQEASPDSNAESCPYAVGASTFREENFLNRVSFRKENFVESLQGCSEKYDTILCLSVSK